MFLRENCGETERSGSKDISDIQFFLFIFSFTENQQTLQEFVDYS